MEEWLSYVSVKLIRVYNPYLALLYYALAIGLLVYVIVYTVVVEKGYQSYDSLVGSSMIKVKGSAHIGDVTNATVYDEYDLVIPPLQPDALFITTNFITTANQTRSQCEGNLVGTTPYDPTTSELCDCPLGNVSLCCELGVHTENGMKLGECAPDGKFCLMSAWCPLETPPVNLEQNLLTNVGNFTVFLRINVNFPHFHETTSNNQGNLTLGRDLFYVSDILEQAGTSYDEVEATGCVIVATFNFDCDLNKHNAEDCLPEITFLRLDSNSNTGSVGFNYRYQETTRDIGSGILYRDLWKVYGINLILQAYGQAGRFNIVALTLTLGSGLALLSLSTVICDLVMQYCFPNAAIYRSEKYQEVGHKKATPTTPLLNSPHHPSVQGHEAVSDEPYDSISSGERRDGKDNP